jgi:hypothetical protein
VGGEQTAHTTLRARQLFSAIFVPMIQSHLHAARMLRFPFAVVLYY